ncbi:MAG TPA: hypothetical protein VK636_05410 [Gemmatimonadaceae bacterium]|nr:hypothetical protein [Gemmatimonadaceae bacterium]
MTTFIGSLASLGRFALGLAIGWLPPATYLIAKYDVRLSDLDWPAFGRYGLLMAVGHVIAMMILRSRWSVDESTTRMIQLGSGTLAPLLHFFVGSRLGESVRSAPNSSALIFGALATAVLIVAGFRQSSKDVKLAPG